MPIHDVYMWTWTLPYKCYKLYMHMHRTNAYFIVVTLTDRPTSSSWRPGPTRRASTPAVCWWCSGYCSWSAMGSELPPIYIASRYMDTEFAKVTWWRHQMETFSALLALCARDSPLSSEFPSQRPATRSFDVFFYFRLNKWLSKQSTRRWFETPSRSLWHHCNVTHELLTMHVQQHPFSTADDFFLKQSNLSDIERNYLI